MKNSYNFVMICRIYICTFVHNFKNKTMYQWEVVLKYHENIAWYDKRYPLKDNQAIYKEEVRLHF